ncbi:hypothetical protein QEH56_15795 [Pelagicoccus enzymogenes]|uniref:hypothetical protein n=1 Tax=Pelagicoccus enzymogenes TaxID=2773457 RepID=UPI00280CD3F4|nr:hypothetical protein [Pelagicoccus enzymogenes]MDQ8199626.1 hypothetical protein [Pelagicoccus enzymogenes]
MKQNRSPLNLPISNLLLAGALALAALMLAGCETTGADSTEVAVPQTVTKGMTKAEVVAILGEPLAVEEVVQQGVTAEIWRYEKEVLLSSTIESDGEEERSYIDHKTGEVVIVREPIYRNERVKGTVSAEILIIDGKVVAFKETQGGPEFEVGAGR